MTATERDLRAAVGGDVIAVGVASHYLSDETEARGRRGSADAVAAPRTTADVAAVVAWCYEHDVPIVPRGGGTGFTGGSVPHGGVVLSLERLDRVRSFEPLFWRIEVEAGVTTSNVRRLARESGLLFPPDPGAAEQSQIGGNVATNAGGPHAFKYGVIGRWVTGIEAVLPPGHIVRSGGALRKDVAGYDLKSLLVGSEGTLGIVTTVSLRLIPYPEAAWPVVAIYGDIEAGCAAIERVLGYGLAASALEYLDGETVKLASRGFPHELPENAAFMVVAEADGDEAAAARLRDELSACLTEDARATFVPATEADVAALWRWRDGVSLAVQAARGGKVSEDIAVPLERLGHAITATQEIGTRHGLRACGWGHAGDGNLHSTFLVDPRDHGEVTRAEVAAADLFDLAIALGGTITGEHGVGAVKRAYANRQFQPEVRDLHTRLKLAFDPKGLLNPGKKL